MKTRNRSLVLVFLAALVAPFAHAALGPCAKTKDGHHSFGGWSGWKTGYFMEGGNCIKHQVRARTCNKCHSTEMEERESITDKKMCEEPEDKKKEESCS